MQVRWAPSGDARKKILFRIAELRGEVAGRRRRGGGDAALDPGDRSAGARRRSTRLDRIFEAGAQHRQRVEILRKRIDLPATRRRARSCGGASPACSSATWATSTRRSPPASASSTRTRRTTSALETLARLYEQQGRHRRAAGDPRAAAVAEPTRRGAGARRAAAADRRAAGGTARRSAARRSGAGARCWRRRPATGTRWRRWSASWRPAPTAACGWRRRRRWSRSTRAAGRFAELAAVVRVYVEAQTDARARLEQLMRLAELRGDAARRQGGRARDDGAGDPRRASRAGAARRCSTTYERLAGIERVDRGGRALPRHQPRRARRGGKLRLDRTIAEVALRRGRRDAGGRLLPARPRSRRPTTATALEALEEIYRKAERRRGAVRDPACGAPSWPAPTRRRARAARCRSARWPRRRSTARRRRSPPTSACWRSPRNDREAARRSIASTPRPSAGAI